MHATQQHQLRGSYHASDVIEIASANKRNFALLIKSYINIFY